MKFPAVISMVACLAGLVHLPTAYGQSPFPASVDDYTGASSSRPFIAIEPYSVRENGALTTANLLGKSRSFDFGGDIPFRNVYTDAPDPYLLQGYDTETKKHIDLDYKTITNAGFKDHVTKAGDRLMIVTRQGDKRVGLSGKTFLVSYPVPQRSHVRWEMDVAFGDEANEWLLLANNSQPVNFWELKSGAHKYPSFAVNVDTDRTDPQKLELIFVKLNFRTNPAPPPGQDGSFLDQILVVPGLERNTNISITIEAFWMSA